MPRLMSVADRFWPKVQRGAGCWEWQAGVNPSGYGWFRADKGAQLAHRVAYTLTNGPIPGGLQVLHHCDNRRCVNPAHLFLGTNQDNVTDKVAKGRHPNSRRTECTHGHPFDLVNTYITPRGTRMCRACNRDAQRRYELRKRERSDA